MWYIFVLGLFLLSASKEAGKQTSSDLWARVRKRERRRKGKFFVFSGVTNEAYKAEPTILVSNPPRIYRILNRKGLFADYKRLMWSNQLIPYTCAVLTFVFVAAVAHP
uniref:Uncharacterized protein n=2 Tax=Aegilops tauschii subsp. strangulata TaxID=200361 RepID=A0A453C5W6_AEGTS